MAQTDNTGPLPGSGNGGNGGGNGADMPPLIIKAQYTKDFSFENPAAPAVFEMMQSEPDVDINVNVEAAKLNGGDFEVSLMIQCDAKAEGKQIFLIELTYSGVFEIAKEIPEEHHGAILLIECPRLMFPFARNIVSDAARDGGFPPLLLQPIDFMAIYQEQMGAEGEELPA